MAKRRGNDPGLAERISEAIADSGLSDTEAAAIMGISAALLSRIRRGERGTIHFQAGLRLAQRLGVDPWDLAFGERSRTQAVSALDAPDTPQDRLSDLEERMERLEGVFRAAADEAAEVVARRSRPQSPQAPVLVRRRSHPVGDGEARKKA